MIPYGSPVDEYMEVMASNPYGIEVTVKEKYGTAIQENATVVWWNKEKACFVLTHRDKPASYYPKENYSIRFKGDK